MMPCVSSQNPRCQGQPLLGYNIIRQYVGNASEQELGGAAVAFGMNTLMHAYIYMCFTHLHNYNWNK